MPLEIPLEPGESTPLVRKKIGTSFQLPQNLINNINNEEESIASLELQMQTLANMAEADLELASESNTSKVCNSTYFIFVFFSFLFNLDIY